MTDNDITEKIIGAAIEVHKELGGPGLLESVYEEALCHELKNFGLGFQRQASCPIHYKGATLTHPLRIDLLVENRIVVECKATKEDNPIYAVQCLTYLRLTGNRVGLVLNFGHPTMKYGIERVIAK